MKQIVFATNNPHKLDEIRQITTGKLDVKSLKDIGFCEEIEEPFPTIEENAVAKALRVSQWGRMDSFADDTALEVEALDGAPGVHTARYAGDNCNPEDNMQKLMEVLKNETNRNAQFRTVIALKQGKKIHMFEGVLKGTLATEKRGEHGFGYDPIFIPEGFSQTLAELGEEVKNNISHRAIATHRFLEFMLKKK